MELPAFCVDFFLFIKERNLWVFSYRPHISKEMPGYILKR